MNKLFDEKFRNSHRPILLVLIVFILTQLATYFIFYDLFNINVDIYSISYLKLGLNPYSYQNPIGVGYLMTPYNTLAYNLFYFTGENFLETAILLKVVGSFFLLLSGLFLYLIMNEKKMKYGKILFLSFIFNPFLLFINMVGPYTSIIPLTFFLGSYYFMVRASQGHRYGNTLMSVTLLMISVFTYYFYIILIPTFIIYNLNKFRWLKQRLVYVLTYILIGALFLFPIIRPISLSSFVTSTAFGSSLKGGTSTILVPYSIYNLVTSSPPSLLDQYMIIIILSFMVPFILKKWYRNDTISMFIVMISAFLLSTSFISPDYLVVLIPIAYLAIGDGIHLSKKRVVITNIILVQMLLIPQFFILVLRNGTNGLVGFYYWGYYFIRPVLFQNFYYSMGGDTSWKVALLVYTLLSFLSIDIILKSRDNDRGISGQIDFQFNAKNILTNKAVKRTIHILVVFILIIIIFSETIFISNEHVSYDNNVNLGFFAPTFYNNGSWAFSDYAMPNPQTYEISGGEKAITFFPSSTGVSLFRNVSDQAMKLNMTYSINNSDSYSSLPLLLTNYQELSINQTLLLNQSRQLFPNSNGSLYNFSLFNSSIYNARNTYKMNSDTDLMYNLSFKKNSSVVEYTKLSKLLYFNTLFTLQSNNTVLQLGVLGNEIYFGINLNNTWNYINESISFNPQSILTSFIYRMANSTFMADINGQNLFIPNVQWRDNTTIIVGRPSIVDTGRIGICGYVSNLKLAKGIPIFANVFLVKNMNSFFPLPFNNTLSLELYTSTHGTSINLENRTFYQPKVITYIWIGPLGSHSNDISIAFNLMEFSSFTPGGYLYFSIFILIAASLTLASIITLSIFKSASFRSKYL